MNNVYNVTVKTRDAEPFTVSMAISMDVDPSDISSVSDAIMHYSRMMYEAMGIKGVTWELQK